VLDPRRQVQRRLAILAENAVRKSADPSRHKCFVSYHADDEGEVASFIESFGHVFIPRVIGLSEEDDFIDSYDTDYVMDAVREQYLTDSTVTIVLLGRCTWSRRFVDWEVYSTLRNDKLNRRSGLLAIVLPSIANAYQGRQQPRVADNIKGENGDAGYARWWVYPPSGTDLRRWIEIAYDARSTKAALIDNDRVRMTSNVSC
jgi:MTH538 TIR-like domain (DUF1863)